MTMFRSLAFGLAVALGLFASHQARATVLDVTGEFEDGALLSGSFDFDFNTGQASNSNVSIGNTLLPLIFWSTMSDDYFLVILGDKNEFTIGTALYFDRSSQPYNIIYEGSFYEGAGGDVHNISSGSATPASVVPLPAALPLAASALAGLGGLGWLKRRRVPVHPAVAA